MAPPQPEATETMRIDKWLWCARFYKTRSIAVDAINKGQVSVNGATVKPSKEIRAGDRIGLKQAHIPKTVDVRALAHTRGPAPIAQQLYAETADSVALRSALEEQRRVAPEPALSLSAGRPTKRDRRQLQNWDDRWTTKLP